MAIDHDTRYEPIGMPGMSQYNNFLRKDTLLSIELLKHVARLLFPNPFHLKK